MLPPGGGNPWERLLDGEGQFQCRVILHDFAVSHPGGLVSYFDAGDSLDGFGGLGHTLGDGVFETVI